MEKLFSYGTLQLKKVQLDTFKRVLSGKKDKLLGYTMEKIKITDPLVIELSGTNEHTIIKQTGNKSHYIDGTLYELTNEEINKADDYEVDDYKRVKVTLESGESGWVYIKK